MLDVHPEIAAFVRRRALPLDSARELQELFGRVGAGGRSVLTTLLDAPAPVDLDRPADADELTAETDERARPTDRYEDLGPIGVGGMGEVRRVRDRDLNRTLAMKTIRADWMARPDMVSRFLEEAQVGAQLQHPGGGGCGATRSW